MRRDCAKRVVYKIQSTRRKHITHNVKTAYNQPGCTRFLRRKTLGTAPNALYLAFFLELEAKLNLNCRDGGNAFTIVFRAIVVNVIRHIVIVVGIL